MVSCTTSVLPIGSEVTKKKSRSNTMSSDTGERNSSAVPLFHLQLNDVCLRGSSRRPFFLLFSTCPVLQSFLPFYSLEASPVLTSAPSPPSQVLLCGHFQPPPACLQCVLRCLLEPCEVFHEALSLHTGHRDPFQEGGGRTETLDCCRTNILLLLLLAPRISCFLIAFLSLPGPGCPNINPLSFKELE